MKDYNLDNALETINIAEDVDEQGLIYIGIRLCEFVDEDYNYRVGCLETQGD